MARSLASKPNVVAPGGAYPYGRIKDKDASPGTPVNELVYGDIHQFFERMMALASVVANGNPENNSSGFQYMEALFALFFTGSRKRFARVNIGNWNMYLSGGGSAVSTKAVTHGITNWKTITILGVSIYNDGDTARYPITTKAGFVSDSSSSGPSGGLGGIGSTTLLLGVHSTVDGITPSTFNSTDFSNNVNNRGHVDLIYEV